MPNKVRGVRYNLKMVDIAKITALRSVRASLLNALFKNRSTSPGHRPAQLFSMKLIALFIRLNLKIRRYKLSVA